MSDHIDLITTTEYLFSLPWDADYTDEELDRLDQLCDDLVAEYGWDSVYTTAINYLHTKCNDDNSVINFATNFLSYGRDRYIPDPIHFIAYLYYRVDPIVNPDAFDAFDSLAITVLPNAGLLDLMENPCYAAETDPRIQAEIAAIRASEI